MAEWTGLRNWLGGGTRVRELDETRIRWDAVERRWRSSEFSEGLVKLSVSWVRQASARQREEPALPILVELSMATEYILQSDDLGPIEPLWELIGSDVEVELNFRKMLTRRERYLGAPPMLDSVKARFDDAYEALFRALPASCFREWREDEGALGVPLIELLDKPAAVIEALFLAPTSNETLQYGLLERLRVHFVENMLVASGFRRDTDINQVGHKLILPTNLRDKTPTELADLYLGGTPFRDLLEIPVPFVIPEETRFEHAHIVGGTGHGKTQLLQRLIHTDLVAAEIDGRSVVVIDSQGDLINKLIRLELFNPERPGSLADRLILIDPSDVEAPASLNLFDVNLDRLRDYRPVDRERVLNGVVELYEVFFGALLGAELTQKQGVIFRYLARLMLAIPGATIHTLMQLMDDGKPFKPYMDKLEGSARYFFQAEFFHPSFAATKKQILRRLWGVLSTPAFERMFGQKENKLDLFDALQSGKIILVSTAKDLLKDEGSALFGRFFIAMLAQAATERATVAEDDRNPTFVYVDEAQEYFDDRIESILTQARKQKVGFHAAHQALDQLSPRLRAAFNSNTSLKCVGGVSAKDARALADELHTTPDFIESMKRRKDQTEFAVRLRNETPQAVRMAVPLGFLERQPTLDDDQLDELLNRNRVRYCGTVSEFSFAMPEAVEEPEAGTQPPSPPAKPATPEPPPAGARPPSRPVAPEAELDEPPPAPTPAPVREAGKGGRQHRYLQALAKELGEAQGFKATVEAPLTGGSQVDVLLERDGRRIAIEISTTTPATWEAQNVRKCIEAGCEAVGLVLTKPKASWHRYQEAIAEFVPADLISRIALLAPEDLPDFVGSFSIDDASGPVVSGYRVKVSRGGLSASAEEARRQALSSIIKQRTKPSPPDGAH